MDVGQEPEHNLIQRKWFTCTYKVLRFHRICVHSVRMPCILSGWFGRHRRQRVFGFITTRWDSDPLSFTSSSRPLGYERVYLPLYKGAYTPFHIQGDAMLTCFVLFLPRSLMTWPYLIGYRDYMIYTEMWFSKHEAFTRCWANTGPAS